LSLGSTASFHRLPRLSERRRTSLTPLESELRFPETVRPQAPSAWKRARRRLRRERRPPKTLLGAGAGGMLRLGIAVALAAALGLGNAGFERGAERFAHWLQLDAVQDVLEEAADDQALRLLA